MAVWKISDEQLRLFQKRSRQAAATGPVTIRSAYVDERRMLHATLTGQGAISLPTRRIPGLRGTSLAELQSVQVGPRGLWLEWPSRNVDLGLVGLVTLLIGTEALQRMGASLAGSRTSAAKAEAARRNGRKGGRPRARTRAA